MRPLKSKSSLVTKSAARDTGSFANASVPSLPAKTFPVSSFGSVQQKIALFENGSIPINTDTKANVISVKEDTDFLNEEQYDLTPIKKSRSDRGTAAASHSLTIDPFEIPALPDEESEQQTFSPTSSFSGSNSCSDELEDECMSNLREQTSTFLVPEEIHPNMENNEEDIQRLRLLAGKLSSDWKHADFLAPALTRRLRDFHFAQEKRRKKYGDERPWGILGVYDHLASIRIDVEWAEEAAKRRADGDTYQSWADYDESKKGRSNRPYFTYVLLFFCTALLVASIAANGWTVEPLNVNPMIGPSAETLILMGAKESTLIVDENQGWRLISSPFLHAGLVHWIINMLALRFVGAAIEMSHGWFASFLIFSLSAIGGIILSAIFLPDTISVGASGGIFGFIGACLADIIMNWSLLFSDFVTENGKKHRHAIVVLVLFLDIVLNTIIGLTPYIDNFTHLGGMVHGFLCGLSAIPRLSADFFGVPEDNWKEQAKQLAVRFCGVIISVASIITTLIVLFKGDPTTTPCPGCVWLSCVPFPPWETKKWWYCDDCGRVTAEIVSKPSFHIELDCPSGVLAFIALDEKTYDRNKVQKDLPQYCREFCPLFESGFNASSLELL